MNDSAQQFFTKLKTKFDIEMIDQEIDLILDNLYTQNFNVVLKNKIRSSTYETIQRICPDVEIHKEQLKNYLTVFKKDLSTYKVMKITIAYNITEEAVEKIANYIQTNFGEKVVIDINTNHRILAGAIFVYEGYYKDFSLASQLDMVLEKKREEIQNVYKRRL